MIAVQWAARISGLLIIALVLLFAIGGGLDVRQMSGTELAMTAAFAAALLGMVTLWKWEGAGGLLTIVGMLAFYGIQWFGSGELPGGWVFPVCFLPGILAIVWWAHHKPRDGESTVAPP